MKILIALVTLLSVTGCIAVKTPSSSDLKKLNNAHIQVAPSTYPVFIMAKGVSAGLLGPAAMPVWRYAGKELAQENHIPDPAEIVKEKFITALDKKFHANKNNSMQKANRFILDVQSNMIQIHYRLSGFYYDLTYVVTAQLKDSATNKVIGQMPCTYQSKAATNKSYTYDELTANKAQLIKDLLKDGGNQCALVMIEGMFK